MKILFAGKVDFTGYGPEEMVRVEEALRNAVIDSVSNVNNKLEFHIDFSMAATGKAATYYYNMYKPAKIDKQLHKGEI
jgi:hypothetical protein